MRRGLAALAASRAFAYGSIAALQAKVLWSIGSWRDLTHGDTWSYYSMAAAWAERLELNVVWSPLYLVYYGSLQWLWPDPFTATLGHRLIAASAASLLALAALRRLLPAGIAWCMAAWWTVLPINFETLYEVHLFAVLPTFCAVALAGRWSGTAARATTLGLLAATTLLVRFEILFALAPWALFCLWTEIRERRARARGRLLAVLRLYLVAALGVVSLWLVLYSRSTYDFAQTRQLFADKHTHNVCQVYAFGYGERHDDWPHDPWLECGELMARDFGEPRPTLLRAFRQNAPAVAEHLRWSASLIPAGLQLMLLNRVSGDRSPDYVPVTLHSRAAALASIAILVLLFAGLASASGGSLAKREPVRLEPWLLLAFLGLAAAAVMVLQRPRPSYLFNLTLFLLATIGAAATVVLRRLGLLEAFERAAPAFALLAILAIPSYVRDQGRDLRTMVARLVPHREILRGRDTRFLSAGHAEGACHYVGGSDPCTAFDLARVIETKPADIPLEAWLDRLDIAIVYVDEAMSRQGEPGARIAALETVGWQRVAPTAGTDAAWRLLRRSASRSPLAAPHSL